MQRNILITGGAGFIGSHVVRRFITKYPQYRIINLDALTYAGTLENLRDIENAPNYSFVKCDIRDDAISVSLNRRTTLSSSSTLPESVSRIISSRRAYSSVISSSVMFWITKGIAATSSASRIA